MIRPGQHLCWSGDPITELWAVQHGSLKAYEVSCSGEERVSGFFFAGDVIGWEALACGSFRASAVALERTVVLPLPATAMLDGALGSPQRQAQLLDGLRGEFVRLEARLGLEHRHAKERMATFLLWVAECQGGDGDGSPVRLPMSRKDIASYLGLATETVSRRLALFQRSGWIRLQRRSVWINDARRLQQLIETDTE